MIVRFKFKHGHKFFAYGGAQAFLLVLAFQIGGRLGWLIALPLMATVSLYGWVSMLKRHRMIADTPTSQIASAAQGYVELVGIAGNHVDTKIFAHLSKKICCWFRYEVEERESDGDWRTVDQGESAASFVLRDPSGSCIIDPEGAEVMCAHKNCWTEGGTRYTEWCIEEGDPVYALGEFRTRSFAPGEAEADEDLSQLLSEWKSDKAGLRRRFDLDHSGQVDQKEWELAVAEARREIEGNHAKLRARPAVDMMMKPADGRAYLLSNHPPENFHRRLGWWAWGHLALLFAALSALVFVLSMPAFA